MAKTKITVEYDGTGYSGWQIQPNGRSIQGELEAAIHHLTGEQVRVYGAGRTDAGVHARGQIATFRAQCAIPPEKYAHALTSRLPKDICVRESVAVPDDFDPRHDAKLKLYRYSIYAASIRPAIGRQYCWHVKWPLDLKQMQAAAGLLCGTHDFTSLSNQERNLPGMDNVRTVEQCTINRSAVDPALLQIDVRGRSFLYNMVRNIAGLLVDIGMGHFSPEEIPEIIAARQRSRAGQGAPACGLCLEWIRYDLSDTPPDVGATSNLATESSHGGL